LQIEKSISGGDLHLIETVGSIRKFIREGRLEVIENNKSSERYLWLFNDLLICAKPRNNAPHLFKEKIYLDKCKLTPISSGVILQFTFMLEYYSIDSSEMKKSFFVASNGEEMQDWIQDIDKYIKEHREPDYSIPRSSSLPDNFANSVVSRIIVEPPAKNLISSYSSESVFTKPSNQAVEPVLIDLNF